MRIIALTVALLFALAAGPGVAADSKASDKPATTPGSSVEMPYLIAPLSVGGTLQGYAYISSKIVGASPAAAIEIREKVPFIQDAFVRDVNASAVGKPDDPMTVDNAVLAARLLALAKKVMGPGKVVDLKLMQVQVSPLQPKTDIGNGPS